jgi:hypothetical protein
LVLPLDPAALEPLLLLELELGLLLALELVLEYWWY